MKKNGERTGQGRKRKWGEEKEGKKKKNPGSYRERKTGNKRKGRECRRA